MFDSKKDAPVIGASIAGIVALILMTLLGVLPGQAHAQSFGQSDIPAQQARSAMNVQVGKVIDVQATAIEVEAPNANRAMGGLIGAALGAFAARDSSWQGQSLAGSVGAFVGDKIASRASKEMRPADQVIVRLENGQVVAVVQESSGSPLGVGETVYMVGQYPAVRVVRANQLALATYR